MSKFYGTLESDTGKAVNKTGNHGISAAARTYEGSVIVRACEPASIKDPILFEILVNESQSSTKGKRLFAGSIDDLISRLEV